MVWKNADFQMKFDVDRSLNILINATEFDLSFELLSMVRNMTKNVNLNLGKLFPN
jgi:hypothetical protein